MAARALREDQVAGSNPVPEISVEGSPVTLGEPIPAQTKSCVSCQKVLDPVAFAVHDRDTLGRFTGKPNLDPKDLLWGARLRTADKTMARSFARNLVAYVIGGNTNIYDMKTVDKILAKTSPTDFRVRDILAGVLHDYFFKD